VTGLEPAAAAELRRRLTGRVTLRDEAGYDRARAIWNAAIDRRPVAVAECADDGDVVAALDFAQELKLRVAVRGGGHSVAGMGTCDDGLVIALGAIDRVEVDAGTRLVRVGGGALLGAVDRASQVHGLAVPAGVVSHTGAGRALARRWGGVADPQVRPHLRQPRPARVVTPDQGVVVTSETERPELLWGLRGGGGNFGIVTEFTFRAYPVPDTLPVATAVWDLEHAPGAIRAYREVVPELPDEAKGTIFFVTADPSLGVPATVVGQPVLALVQPWIGEDAQAAARAFAPLRDAAPALVAGVVPTRWLDLQTREDEVSGHGRGNYTKGGYLDAIDDALIEAMISAARTMPGPLCQLEVIPHGGAQLRVAESDSAFSDRAAPYSFNVYSRWSVTEDDASRFVEWSRGTYAAMQPYIGSGVYTNFFAADDGHDRVLAAYGRKKYDRLARLKASYDAGNVLSVNQNIRPATAGT
jgi:FAD/FMN-containing dehydrogenase